MGKADCYNNIGLAFYEMGQHDQSLVNYLKMLKEKVSEDEDTSRMVEIIEDTSRQGTELATKFLDISKSSWVPHQEVTFDDILAAAADCCPAVKPLLKHVSAPP